MIQVSAPGNLFFAGEHAVVYGFPSINVSINKTTTSALRMRADRKVILESKVFGRSVAEIQNDRLKIQSMDNKALQPLMDLVQVVVRDFEADKGFGVQIDSGIPVESGMSSSTAVLCSLLKSILQGLDEKISDERFFEIVYSHQVGIHGGKASGSEIVSSMFGGFHRIQKTGKSKFPVEWKNLKGREMHVVVGNTKVRSPTALTVGSHIPSMRERYPEKVNDAWKEIETIVNRIEAAIGSGSLGQVGELMNRNQEILDGLLLSHPKLDDCIREARKAGALGAKLSGGGWGGVMFALVREEDRVKVAEAIKRTGSEAIIAEIGTEGLRVEKAAIH